MKIEHYQSAEAEFERFKKANLGDLAESFLKEEHGYDFFFDAYSDLVILPNHPDEMCDVVFNIAVNYLLYDVRIRDLFDEYCLEVFGNLEGGEDYMQRADD